MHYAIMAGFMHFSLAGRTGVRRGRLEGEKDREKAEHRQVRKEVEKGEFIWKRVKRAEKGRFKWRKRGRKEWKE